MSWQDLQQKPPQPGSAGPTDLDILHASVFGTGHGKELLALYHRTIVEQPASRDATEAELRYRDAQRHLIVGIEQAVARGMRPRKEPSAA